MARLRRPPSQTWRTFLANHVHQIVAMDFFVVPTATYRLLFVLVILAHDRRRIVHTAVTARLTAAWTMQQLRDAFPWDQAPRYLVRDRDRAFEAVTSTATAMGIEEVLTAPRSPWQNAYAERFIGVGLEFVVRRQGGSWTRSLQWETQRTWFRSAGTAVCRVANVSGVLKGSEIRSCIRARSRCVDGNQSEADCVE